MVDKAENNKALVYAFVHAINERNWSKLDTVISPHFIRHSYAAGDPGVKSREELIQFFQTQESIFPKFKEKILDLVAEGDKVAARHHFKGTQLGKMGSYPVTCKDMDIEYLAIYRIEDSIIVEAWMEWDNYTSMKQLGHLNMMKTN